VIRAEYTDENIIYERARLCVKAKQIDPVQRFVGKASRQGNLI